MSQPAIMGTEIPPDEVTQGAYNARADAGESLEAAIQRALEDRMDADFSDVRIHTGGAAAKAAEAIDAKAFTCGNDIAFNSGEYDPNSPEGQHLLAHELAHVTQQNGGAPISMMPKEGANLEIDPDPQLEREADEAAKEALAGGEPLTVRRLGTDVHIQRSAKDSTLSRRELITLGNPEKGAMPDQAADQSKIRRFLEEFSRLEFSLTHGELESVVENVSSVNELYDYLAAQGIEPTSDLEEWINSPLVRGYKSGSAASSVMGLLNLGFTPAAIAALAVGGSVAFVLRRYGDEIGEEARKWLRSKLDEQHDDRSWESGTGDSQGENLGK